jgi:hypothetical protein
MEMDPGNVITVTGYGLILLKAISSGPRTTKGLPREAFLFSGRCGTRTHKAFTPYLFSKEAAFHSRIFQERRTRDSNPRGISAVAAFETACSPFAYPPGRAEPRLLAHFASPNLD